MSLSAEYGASNHCGLALGKIGRQADAIAAFDRALALKPDYVEALYNRGAALARLNRLQDAIADFERALVIDPKCTEALNNYGTALQILGRNEEAIAYFDRALAIVPNYVEALCNRGTALKALHRSEDAVAAYDRALAANPSFVEALHRRENNINDQLGKLDMLARAICDASLLRLGILLGLPRVRATDISPGIGFSGWGIRPRIFECLLIGIFEILFLLLLRPLLRRIFRMGRRRQ
jgi:tetratricopeptide (TPR) repeat protein